MKGAPIATGRADGTGLTERWGSEDGAPGGRTDLPVATARLRPPMVVTPTLSVLGAFSSDDLSSSSE
jgi:hypothetical protein